MTFSRRTFLASSAALVAGQGCRQRGPNGSAGITAAPGDCTLLGASGLSYGIDLTGKYTANLPYSNLVQYSPAPVTISSKDQFGRGELNACLVGKHANAIVVAFRGTMATSILDWLQDLLVKPERCDPLPGAVHAGFYKAVMSIMPGVIDAVKKLDPVANPVYVTGHSKGGAMAPIAAYLLRQAIKDIKIAQVVTFAAPRPGDADFRDEYKKLAIDHISYENYGDLVPLVPADDQYLADQTSTLAKIPIIGARLKILKDAAVHAAEWNYQPLGAKSYIDGQHKIVSNENHHSQVDDCLRNLAEHPTDALLKAHDLENGYMLAVCPAGAAANR
jgi:hypothetical protein